MTLYVFDVDGTLTEPAKRMSDDMAAVFAHWSHGRRYFLTSGSTLETMRRQLPPDILAHAEGWFPCQGNEYWTGGSKVYARKWPGALGLESELRELADSGAENTCIEHRSGMLCFSKIGRMADADSRTAFAEWDARMEWRRALADGLMADNPGLAVHIGGQTSVDISPEGADKRQILTVIRALSSQPVMFFADKAHPGGNDYPLAEALRAEGSVVNAVFHVKSPQDTRAMLEQMEAHDCSC